MSQAFLYCWSMAGKRRMDESGEGECYPVGIGQRLCGVVSSFGCTESSETSYLLSATNAHAARYNRWQSASQSREQRCRPSVREIKESMQS